MRFQAAAVVVAVAAHLPTAGKQKLSSIYVDMPATQCVASSDLLLKIDGAPVPISRATRGPHPLSAVLVIDTSPSMPRLAVVEEIAKRISMAARPADRFRLATFGPKILISTTLLANEESAKRAAREVTQAKESQRGPSPLWDAMYQSVAVRAPDGIHVVMVLTDARSTGNDRSFAEVYDEITRTGTVVLAVGVADEALPGGSNMVAVGRNDALRKLAVDSAGEFTEINVAYRFLADRLDNIRHRCRLDFAPPAGDGAHQRLSLTASGVAVRAPVRIPR